MHSIKSNFDKILCILKDVLGDDLPISGDLLHVRPGPRPKFTDIEVIALSLASECIGLYSENKLFNSIKSDYKNDFPILISRRQYNDRRKALFPEIERIRQLISKKLNEINEIYAIDSMPIEVCRFSRRDRTTFGKYEEYAVPEIGKCIAQGKDYFGYKLHTVCSPSGVIQVLDLAPANIHDSKFLPQAGNSINNCLLIGDKGYVGEEIKKELWQKANIKLVTPPKKNAKNPEPFPYVYRYIRKRIETVFSQLTQQFHIQINLAKTFYGLRTRILSKVTGMTILNYINKFFRNAPIGQIQNALMWQMTN